MAMPDSGAVGNVIKLAGELVVPGASGLVDGDIKAGVGHTLLGVAGRALLGPVGLLLVKANSYSYSVSEKHLHQHILDLFVRDQPATTESPASDA
jgi:hypothetical protein